MAYSRHRFGDRHQLELAGLFKRLDKEVIKMMLSNSDPKNHNPEDDFFDTLYGNFYPSCSGNAYNKFQSIKTKCHQPRL